MRGNWKLAYRREVFRLELALERYPVLPGALERQAEDLLELIGVVALAALVAADPFERLFRRVRVGEPREKPCAVKIGVRANLEVDLDAARHEAERVVEMRAVAHHRTEHHLVVAALCAAEASAHERLDEHRLTFGEPARNGEARDREVAVEQRFGKLRIGTDLAQKKAAPFPVFFRRD